MLLKHILKNINDLMYNALGFALYNACQQLIIMPFLAMKYSNIVFAESIMFITIFNLVASMIGNELGNVLLIKSEYYIKINKLSDFYIILIIMIIVLCVTGCIALLVLNKPVFNGILIVSCIAMGIYRYYYLGVFRMKQEYKNIFAISILYIAGAMIGLWITMSAANIYAVFVAGEIPPLLFILFYMKKESLCKINCEKTNEFRSTATLFVQLSIVTLVLNSTAYVDRFIILPILGSTSMAAFYCASSMSKMVSLITNPMSSYILSKLNNNHKRNIDKCIQYIIRYGIFLVVLMSVIIIMVSDMTIKILYKKYYDNTTDIIIPLGITVSFIILIAFLKPIMLKYINTKLYMNVNIVMFVLFVAIAYLAVNIYGIKGMAWTMLGYKIVQTAIYVYNIKYNQSEIIANSV